MTTSRLSADDATAAFEAFVGDPSFPCLAGKGVVHSRNITVGVYGELGTRAAARALSATLEAFTAAVDPSSMRSLVAVFPDRLADDEDDFERMLWRQLQLLHAADPRRADWDPSVSDDPDDEHFAFSFSGHAIFVVGMHPASSRLARRFRWPALVFNPRAQFDHLRETGRFARLRDAVREREIALQGSLNPNLADFGEASEARQYSGRAVEPEWKCPFHRERP